MTSFTMMMEAGTLRGILNVLSSIVDECRLEFEKDRLVIKVVDPAHVAMIDMDILPGTLMNYKCTDPGEIGIDIDVFKEHLQELDNNELVTLSYDNDNKMSLTYGCFWNTINPVDTSGMSNPKIPSLSLPAMFKIQRTKLKKIFRTLGNRMDLLVISYHPDEGVSFWNLTEDDELTKAKLAKDLLEEMKWLPAVTEPYDCVSNFPEDYLNAYLEKLETVTLGHKELFEVVKITMGNDYPLILTAETKDLTIRYLLAPRITSE